MNNALAVTPPFGGEPIGSETATVGGGAGKAIQTKLEYFHNVL